ncbi:Hypothetical predicted protein [Paramuricea clavata]|uniref:Uncharacterized protein n=1 Tax=Paramuricea clavata TaxID=317549 RepID=A0A6S7K7F0_PARCT|nr:Hypothetical predicted protein [Paramuricea clavata]
MGVFTDEQHELVSDTLMGLFGRSGLNSAGYISKVLLAEALIKIYYMQYADCGYEEAESALYTINLSKDPSLSHSARSPSCPCDTADRWLTGEKERKRKRTEEDEEEEKEDEKGLNLLSQTYNNEISLARAKARHADAIAKKKTTTKKKKKIESQGADPSVHREDVTKHHEGNRHHPPRNPNWMKLCWASCWQNHTDQKKTRICRQGKRSRASLSFNCLNII